MKTTQEYLDELHNINRKTLLHSEDPAEIVYVEQRKRIDSLKERIEKLENK